MPDRISNYRQVRLVLTPGRYVEGHSHWSLHALVVHKGIPFHTGLGGGLVPLLEKDCTEQQIRESIIEVADQLADRRRG